MHRNITSVIRAGTTLAALLLLASCSTNGDVDVRRYDLYLLIGQSNMAGRGEVSAIDRATHERVFMLTKDRTWVAAAEPMHFDKPERIGVGPGLSFGKAMAMHDQGRTIGLVPAAVGGSAISAWTPSGYHAQTESFPYDDAIARARSAMKSGTFKGILWHQGESDSKPEKVKLYRAALAELVARLRHDLDAPDIPFLVGGLGEFDVKIGSDGRIITSILRDIPSFVENSAFVSAEGLTDKGDKIHFDARSARELGGRYATRLIAMRDEHEHLEEYR